MKQAKLDKLFTLVVEYVVDLEELQMSPAKLADPMELQCFKQALMTGRPDSLAEAGRSSDSIESGCGFAAPETSMPRDRVPWPWRSS